MNRQVVWNVFDYHKGKALPALTIDTMISMPVERDQLVSGFGELVEFIEKPAASGRA